jgi:two-component system NtrC family sensor kinase
LIQESFPGIDIILGYAVKIKHISIKIFLLIATGLFAGELFHTVISLRIHRKHLLDRLELNSSRTSEVIHASIYHGMLENDKESIQRTIETIGHGEGVTAVRIYNKLGKIMVSTVEEEVGKQVNMAAEACDGCHIPGQPLPVKSEAKYSRIYRQPNGVRQFGVISPIKNEPTCSDAVCHAHPPENTVLGVLDVQVSLAAVDQSLIDETKQLIVLSGITILLVAGLAGFFLWRTIHAPVHRLMQGTREVAAGNLDHRIDIQREDEIGRLAGSFNTMVASLESAQMELQQWGDTLEEQVELKTNELEQIQRQILQVEKITSLGRLSTTAAHELNNPLASILNYSKLLLRELDRLDLSEELAKGIRTDLAFIRDESKRCGEIVKNLLLFARRTGGSFEQARVQDVVERSLMLVTHKMEMQNTELKLNMEYCDDTITCDPAQLQQAFVALLINALEAMPQEGTLHFEYISDDKTNQVEFRIADTGIGIPKEHLDHIYEPFYTTKHDSRSVGMGLSVVYGIIRRHKGTISILSKENQGTTCIIRLPRDQTLAEEIEPVELIGTV